MLGNIDFIFYPIKKIGHKYNKKNLGKLKKICTKFAILIYPPSKLYFKSKNKNPNFFLKNWCFGNFKLKNAFTAILDSVAILYFYD
jgi:hypothetical protein